MEIAAKQLELAEKDQQRLARAAQRGGRLGLQKEKADLAFKAAQEQYKSAKENHEWRSAAGKKKRSRWPRPRSGASRPRNSSSCGSFWTPKSAPRPPAIVEVKHVEVGELAVAGGMLFSLIDLDQTYVKAFVPEKYMGQVKLGSRVAVACDSFPGKAFEGKVDYISDEAEFAPKNIQTKEERLKLVYHDQILPPESSRRAQAGHAVDVKISFD